MYCHKKGITWVRNDMIWVRNVQNSVNMCVIIKLIINVTIPTSEFEVHTCNNANSSLQTH